MSDTFGSSCDLGYFSVGIYSGDYQACFDFDECKHASLNSCPENSDCVNTDGSYTCACKDGFEEDIDGFCLNINECVIDDSCEFESGAICTDKIGSFECSCPTDMQGTGYKGDHCHYPNPCPQYNEIVINMQSKRRFKVHTVGEKTIIYRIRLPQVPETEDYTGFFAFSSKDCGEDFIFHLGNGKIM